MSGRRSNVFHQAGFGYFHFQTARGQLVALDQVGDHARQFAVVQLHGGQVNGHAQLGQTRIVPLAQLVAGLIQDPLADADDDAILLGQRNKQIRRHQSAFGMMPTQQRFNAHHAVIFKGHLRLVHQVKLVALQSAAQLLVQLAAYAHLAVQAGDIELVPITRARLGQHHGLLGLLQQLFGVVAVVREQGNADGRAQADRVFANFEWAAQIVQNGLGQLCSFVGLTDACLHQRELIAAQACQAAQSAAVGTQAVCQGHQQAVAGLVAELFVDFLEVIQAAAQHGNTALTAAGVGKNARELFLQHAAIGQAGQVVVLGHVQQVCLSLAPPAAVAFD